MRLPFLLLPFLLLPGIVSPAVAAPAPEPAEANIVLIVADDLGYGDLGCFGCKDIPTPNIDALARDGLRLTRAYAYNVCSPTRAALLTGRYAERSGIRTVLMGGSVPRFAKATTIAKRLRDAGYATGLVGKWHLGYDGDVRPTRMGFGEFYGFLGGKLDYFKHTDSTQKNGTPDGRHDFWEGETAISPEGYTTDLFTARAVKFIGDHAAGPFFLELAYNAPHYAVNRRSYEAPEAYLKKFGAPADPAGTRAGYAAMVACLDDGVGRVLTELRNRKLDDRTLVVFISDNGAEDAGSNGALSGGKHSDREGGIRVPWIVRLPGVVPPGRASAEIMHVTDIAPTLLAISGIAPPKDAAFDGVNLLSVWEGKTAVPERILCFPPNVAVSGKWKLIGEKLYDLEADPLEKTDVAAKHPELVAKLAEAVRVWRADVGLKPKP